MAQTTRDAPRTMSPPAKTPGSAVIMRAVVHLQRAPAASPVSAGSPNSAGRSSGSKPSALMARSQPAARSGCRRSAPPAAGPSRPAGRDASARARTPVTWPSASPTKPSGAASQTNSHALLLGVRHLAHGARHVGLVAAVEAGDGGRALAHGGAHAVHRGVAAADARPPACPPRSARRRRTRAPRRRGCRGWRRSGSRAPARCRGDRRPAPPMSRAL